jgi:hypothetical protein
VFNIVSRADINPCPVSESRCVRASRLQNSLPKALALDLSVSGCGIPQVDLQPGNVVSGRFGGASEIDWAALCSREKTSRIRVYWNGNPSIAVELANDADANYLEPNGVVFEDLSQLRLTASFSRRIIALSADYIHEHLERTPAVTVTHDGIWDGADRQRGSVWYWHEGRWLNLGPMPMPETKIQL